MVCAVWVPADQINDATNWFARINRRFFENEYCIALFKIVGCSCILRARLCQRYLVAIYVTPSHKVLQYIPYMGFLSFLKLSSLLVDGGQCVEQSCTVPSSSNHFLTTRGIVSEPLFSKCVQTAVLPINPVVSHGSR